MASSSPRIVIKGHRVNAHAAKSNSRTARTTRAFGLAFAEALAEEVGVAVSEKLGSGKWWTSRKSRYGYYRSWVKYRYGSDRNRKRQGRQGKPKLQDRVDLTLGLPKKRGDVEDFRFKWLVRQLKRVTVKTGARGRDQYWIPPDKFSGPINVTRTVVELNKVLEKNLKVSGPSKSGLSAQERRLRNIGEFMDGEGARLLRTTKYGQTLMRLAEREALRHARNQDHLKSLYGPKVNYQVGAYKGRALRAANSAYRYGVQTGRLRDAWLSASVQVKSNHNGQRLVITPVRNDAGIHPLRLTAYLKNQIARQGGDPRLLGPKLARKAVRAALHAMQDEGGKLGVRLK